VCVVTALILATFAGVFTLVLLPILVWTFVLYVRCTRDAIKGERHGEH
jgi:hypothetical protein